MSDIAKLAMEQVVTELADARFIAQSLTDQADDPAFLKLEVAKLQMRIVKAQEWAIAVRDH